MKKTKIVLIAAILLGGVLLRRPISFYLKSFSYQRSFMLLLKEDMSNERNLDLRKFEADEWDEVLWVAPYEDPCEKIEEFKQWWFSCRVVHNPATFKMVFLKDGIPVARFHVFRSDLEFVESPIPKRFTRDDALFKFDHFDKFPTVQHFEE